MEKICQQDSETVYGYSVETTIKSETMFAMENALFLERQSEEWLTAMLKSGKILDNIKQVFAESYRLNFTRLPEAIQETGERLMKGKMI